MRESALVRNQLCGLGDVGPGNLIIFLPSVSLDTRGQEHPPALHQR